MTCEEEEIYINFCQEQINLSYQLVVLVLIILNYGFEIPGNHILPSVSLEDKKAAVKGRTKNMETSNWNKNLFKFCCC